MSKRKLTDEQEEELCRLYENKTLSTKGIAEKYGLCTFSVLRIARKHGVVTRPRALPKHAVDHTAFIDAESRPTASYFIGLMLTDGCVWKQKTSECYLLRLTQVEPRHDLVSKFKLFLQAEQPIRLRLRDKNGYLPEHRLEVVSRSLFDSLVSYGVVPNKTSKQTVDPRLQESRDFWRGVFDGDGHITLHRQRGLIIYFGTTSPDLSVKWVEFCSSLVDSVDIHTNNVHTAKGRPKWDHWLYGEPAMRIAEAMYADSEVYCDVKHAEYVKALKKYRPQAPESGPPSGTCS